MRLSHSLLFIAVILMSSRVSAVSFLTEKDILNTKFACSNEQNLPGSSINSAVWICTDESGNSKVQISRRQSSLDEVDTLQLILITDNNQVAEDTFVELSRSVATRYAKQNSSDIVNIIKNCQEQRNFQSEMIVDAGCIKGPVKTERHLIVRMNSKN